MLVDSQAVANVSDDAGLVEMLTEQIDYFKQRPAGFAATDYFARQRLSS
jgi:hypothetical protein